MRVRFHIPQNVSNVRTLIEQQDAEGNPSEGPTFSLPPRTSTSTRYQRGGTRSSRYASSEGAEGTSEGPPRLTGISNALQRNVLREPPSSFLRTRSILTKRLTENDADFGPFKDIVTMSTEGLDIADINQAKTMVKNTGLVPVTFKFFVDTQEIRNHRITSAEISFEKPSRIKSPSSYTGTVISSDVLNSQFRLAGARRNQKILETMYVNFENIYALTEDIEYSVSVSESRLGLMKRVPEFAASNVLINTLSEPLQIPMSPTNIVPNYMSQNRNFALGRAPDPGAEINRLPGTQTLNANVTASGMASSAVGTSTFLRSSNLGQYPSGPTGASLLSNRMSTTSFSLTERTAEFRSKNVVGFRSRIMPVIVTAALPNLKFNSSIQVRIRLKSDNDLEPQIVAAGSNLYPIENKYRACLLPIEPPELKALALGSGLVQIETRQKDPAGSHVSIFGKFFNKNGSSTGPWSKLKTFRCPVTALTVLDFSANTYEFAAIRAVATNSLGYGSKYSAASVKNFRPVTISENDTIVGDIREMPTIIALNKGNSAMLVVANMQKCQHVTIIREDLSTGNVGRLASIIVDGKDKTNKLDRSVKIGSTYRYYLVYKTINSGETRLISYKDDVYTHRETSPDVDGVTMKKVSQTSSTGSKLSLRDDTIRIDMSVHFQNSGLKNVLKMLKDAGIENLVENDTASVMKNFDKFFATQTTRISLTSGKRDILSMEPISMEGNRFSVIDGPATRAKSPSQFMDGPIPGEKYIYVTRLYSADIASILGSDTTSTTPVFNPGPRQSVLKAVDRRFFVSAQSLRSILPSNDFTADDKNYTDVDAVYQRNFTGIEIVANVSIPEDHNYIKNVSIRRVTDQVVTLTWDYGGDEQAIDHFMILEKSPGKTVPVGAKIAFTTVGKHTFHITDHELEYDKTYIVKAYSEDGEIIAEKESSIFIPPSPIPNDILKVHSLKSLAFTQAIQNISL